MEKFSEYLIVKPERSKLINIEYSAVENKDILRQVFENSSGRVNITNAYNINSRLGITKEIEDEDAIVHSAFITFSENIKYLDTEVEVSKLKFIYNFIVEITDAEKCKQIKEFAKVDYSKLSIEDKKFVEEMTDYINKKMYPGFKHFIELIYAQSGNIKKLPAEI